ncbi:MAG: bifunctional nuclease domain-containing protein, partial [Candidatus Binatia bacterium]
YRGQELQIDSRPSDAIAVALRMNAPIYVASQVFAKARQLPSTKKPIPVTRRLMGLHVQDLTSQLATLLDLQIQQGVLVGDVEFGSPASKADIQRGDIVLRANDVVIHKVADLESFVKNTERPLHVQLKLLRKGEIVAVGFDLPS